jgi:hypothetical protein
MISVMIRDPPADACEIKTVPLGYSTMVGEIDERGLLNGLMKLAVVGIYPKAFVVFGMLKSVTQLLTTAIGGYTEKTYHSFRCS